MIKHKVCSRLMLLVFFLISSGSLAWAESQVPRVAVLPFLVRGSAEPQKVQKAIDELIVRQLGMEGVTTVDPQEVGKLLRAGESVQNEEQARGLGRRVQADYSLMGSFNQIGNAISLDARLVHVGGQKPTEIVFAEERGLESLAAATNTVVQRLCVHLLAKAVIAEVQVRGNERIEPDAIKLNVKSKKGEILRPEQVAEDIKTIYKMGLFEKVDAEVSDTPAGKVLTFVVQENPTIQEVQIKGNKEIKEKDILAAIATRPFSVVQRNIISEDVQKIIKLYHQKGYFNAQVTSSVDFPKDPRKAIVTFTVKENKKVYIRKIDFVGNKSFSARKLRGVMQTKEKMLVLSWFTDRGILQRDILDSDVDRLTIFYHDKGFMDAKVGSPEVSMKEDGFYITVPIEEGSRYKVSSVKITGDLLEENDKIIKSLQLQPKDFFGREKLREDMEKISKSYMNEGYAYTQVEPVVKRDAEDRTTDVTFDVTRKNKVHIGRIFITGNTKTRDKVIRRELKIAEGDLFNASALEQSMTNLRKLDFFEDVEIVPTGTEQTDVMDLMVKVKEKLTGSISVGGGYSSEDGVFASGEITQRNLFGKGQYLGLKAYVGQEAQRYVLSFTEPYLWDRPVSGGIDLFNWLRQYPDFTQDATGFRLRSAYRFGNYSKIGGYYTLQSATVTDVPDDAPPIYFQSAAGRKLYSTLTATVERDSTDHPFLPTRGSISNISVEYGGPYLGSDFDYLKTEVHHGVFVPLFWKLVGYARGEFGYIKPFGDDNTSVPLYSRFFLGGINSLRGFAWATVGPESAGYDIGGLTYGLTTVELLFPLIEKIGMRGVVFFDAGNAYRSISDFSISDFRTDAGVGIRWNSPLGPLRVEWGYNLDPREGEDQYQWQFSAGAFF